MFHAIFPRLFINFITYFIDFILDNELSISISKFSAAVAAGIITKPNTSLGDGFLLGFYGHGCLVPSPQLKHANVSTAGLEEIISRTALSE